MLAKSWKLQPGQFVQYEPYLSLSALLVITLGLVILASASMTVAEGMHQIPFYFVFHQFSFLAVGFVCFLFVLYRPITFWQKGSRFLFLLSMVLLALVLVPGIGKEVNGSMRWINVGITHLQVSEFMKLAMIIYLAAYCARQKQGEGSQIRFGAPLVMLAIVAFLLLLEPDFGTAVVITTTSLAILFLAGVRLRIYVLLILLVAILIALLAVMAPYRMDRLTTFLNPWRDAFSEGYQLTQSLIAFGRGEWFGLGLGNSVQKLFYLPEAHTDFLLAVLAEELGLLGILVITGLFFILIARGFQIALSAAKESYWFQAYLAFGLSFLLAIQVVVNMGVNMGLLPTKGLTLPLMSYGGSSLVANCILLGLLVRLSFERSKNYQL